MVNLGYRQKGCGRYKNIVADNETMEIILKTVRLKPVISMFKRKYRSCRLASAGAGVISQSYPDLWPTSVLTLNLSVPTISATRCVTNLLL